MAALAVSGFRRSAVFRLHGHEKTPVNEDDRDRRRERDIYIYIDREGERERDKA